MNNFFYLTEIEDTNALIDYKDATFSDALILDSNLETVVSEETGKADRANINKSFNRMSNTIISNFYYAQHFGLFRYNSRFKYSDIGVQISESYLERLDRFYGGIVIGYDLNNRLSSEFVLGFSQNEREFVSSLVHVKWNQPLRKIGGG